jgi:uncharacterized protein (DUF58 family)
VRIPKTSIQTSWRADWLVDFSIALIVLAFLAREIIFAAVGAGILLSLVSLGILFHRRLGVLRRELHVAERLPKTGVCLGDSIEGDLTIRNGSRLAAQILAVTPVVEKGLSLKLSSSSNQSLRPGTTSSSKFQITSLKSGRFRISGFTLAFTDSRGLFTGEVNYEQADWVEVYPSVRTKVPITPLRLYGGRPEIFRKGPAGMDYAGVRQYVPGDEYHRVEWKATARVRTLMVKEFHPETQATLQILIDTGRTMREQSYVGTRLDEALAVAQLLIESAAGSIDRVGISVYNETGVVRALKPASPEEQRASLREFALFFQKPAGKRFVSFVLHPATLWRERFGRANGERLLAFMRLLELKLRLGYRKTGVYRALTEATSMDPESLLIILTDMETNNDSIAEAASTHRKERVIVAQIGATWRLSDTLEDAYAEYQRNGRKLQRLQQMGLIVFDVSPERVIEAVSTEVIRIISTAASR